MLTLQGTVVNVLRHAQRTGRDGKTYEAYNQVQIMVEEPLQDGQKRVGVQTLITETPEAFERLTNRPVAVPVSVYIRNGSPAFFMQKGASPEALSDRSAS